MATDNSTLPSSSSSCNAASDDVDVVQGYKIRRADGPMRAVIGRAYHAFVSFFFRLRIRDTDCDFRLIRRTTLDEVELVHTTGVICVEMVRKLQDVGARFTEVGVHHYPPRARQVGVLPSGRGSAHPRWTRHAVDRARGAAPSSAPAHPLVMTVQDRRGDCETSKCW